MACQRRDHHDVGASIRMALVVLELERADDAVTEPQGHEHERLHGRRGVGDPPVAGHVVDHDRVPRPQHDRPEGLDVGRRLAAAAAARRAPERQLHAPVHHAVDAEVPPVH
jgi:hypothetical protein